MDRPAIPISGCSLTSVSSQERVVILNRHGDKLVGILHETGSKEVVIVCHGFRSSKDRIPMTSLAAALEVESVSAFRFDFPGNGESEGSFQFGNYRREAGDLHDVVQHFSRNQRIVVALVGHSKGGNVVLLYASMWSDVQTIINISGRFNLDNGIEARLGKDFQKRIRQNGFIDIKNKRGNFIYRVTEESLTDRLTTDTRTSALSIHPDCRVLTVHGSKDEVVSPADALEFSKFICNHRLHLIDGADHEYTSHQLELVSAVLDFIRADLMQENRTQGCSSIISRI
ncbi:unnamed protein product [Rhodiola kirilowii]